MTQLANIDHEGDIIECNIRNAKLVKAMCLKTWEMTLRPECDKSSRVVSVSIGIFFRVSVTVSKKVSVSVSKNFGILIKL